MKTQLATAAAAVLAIALAGCGGHTSAVSSQGSQASPGSTDAYGPSAQSQASAADTPMVAGKPMWAANRRHSASENAQYQFARNGVDFGAHTETDYVTKVHAFVDHPPTSSESLDRANGDRLIYDPKSNTFAVVSRDGAPRTMFKPRDGAAYWTEQKKRESERNSEGSNQS
jgi:pyocin large subunit-like protein